MFHKSKKPAGVIPLAFLIYEEALWPLEDGNDSFFSSIMWREASSIYFRLSIYL